MHQKIKIVLLAIVICLCTTVVVALLTGYISSIVIQMTTRVDTDSGLGYLAILTYLTGFGGLIGLISGIIVSAKIWRRIK